MAVEEFGPYLVYEQIGLGGMASVHRAETQGIAGFRRPVALKRMLPWVAANEELVRSFVREARLASHLRHANVAQTLDLGKVDDVYFIAMELVPGKNLREILSQCLRVVGAMPLAIAISIISQIADALDYAHNLCDETGTPLGIIHRDVSPSNVIVSEGGVVKLIDFGIAKASAQSMQTMSRTIKGKFGYMAPEYIEGRIDARADLFALGVISHELLANRPLFQGADEMDTLYNVRAMKIEPPSHYNPKVPPEIDAIVMTALSRDPSTRWQGANALRTALTTEAKQLGLVALGQQVFDWVEWAFSRKGGEFQVESEPEISISGGTKQLDTAEVEELQVRPSAPHPRLVQRPSSPPPPANEFSDNQRTLMIEPKRQSSLIEETFSAGNERTLMIEPDRQSSLIEQTSNLKRPTIPEAPAALARTTIPEGTLRTPQTPSVITARPTNQMPAGLAPIGSVPSGARTAKREATQPLADEDLVSFHRAESAVSAAMTQIKPGRSRGRGILLAILVLLAAAGTAAVVYFALPYFT